MPQMRASSASIPATLVALAVQRRDAPIVDMEPTFVSWSDPPPLGPSAAISEPPPPAPVASARQARKPASPRMVTAPAGPRE